ncbi:MAG TPA: helix-turn-helix domain-containing protein [Nocardioides sp.]|uniref:TetR/AcrR family transcriptional regulator n=1 Tax=uncultured Nocardioides sp. TaxID=198441 RepID=UPI000EDF732D|nr:helix-turn-helix domain-containing protein [uncultured Nocardioides sp.]HCB07230.1 TetR family transcriptional regulator [Nocardioides sp.]HRD62878.1 helix-turn-helix domain-containing protein [Nocardioides sp.]HRI96385.1 helix-turn-helix domain-containing protein [Nocardioides sp.]HRK46542.1 helix-turn-helix domain-containing protein [Nocardioides sp.]
MPATARPKRSDAVRNEQSLLDAAAAVFVRSGVDAPVREIAREAGVGTGTIYRHFPARADLVVAVFQHQVDSLAAAGDDAVLRDWILQFADFLVTKHGLADAMASDRSGFERLHTEFVVRLEPVCARLLDAEVHAGRVRDDVRPLELMRAVGNLCIGAEGDDGYDARRMIEVLLAGMTSLDRG